MVLVIDTSSARSALAVLSPELEPLRETVRESGRDFDLASQVAALADSRELTAIAVARGPGSFTGLRIGAAYAVGLALGRDLPLRPFGSLHLQRARSPRPATAVVEAGRGRVYFLAPDGSSGIAEPAELPPGLPAAGWLRSATAAGLAGAGVRLLPDRDLVPFGAAAAAVVAGSPEIPCDSLTLDYMQSFRRLR